MIPTGFLQDLLARSDIVEVVGRHVQLKKSGANLMGLCPFHAEKSPSFSVSPGKQFYHCFGCGAGGDAIRFLTEHTGMSFIDAVRDLAQSAGMQVPEENLSPEDQARRQGLRQRRLTLIDVLGRAANFYRNQLKASPVAIDYLKRRGLTGEIAARFGLGYAPTGWHALAGVFPDYADPLLEESGLVRAPADDDGTGPAAAEAQRKRYDWFRHRVIFPIRSVQGEILGFGGRVLDDSKPKYMNSPETPVFSKGRELYGLFEARQAIRDRGHALVVEGYMDVVALAQAGFANAVATLGTACTADHVQKLFRFTDSVVFSFDGDAAGRRAAARALEAALPFATDLRTVRFLFLPPEHDPDSFVRELGAPAFEAAVAGAVPLSRRLLDLAAEDLDLDTAEGRARMLAQARPLWAALPDGALKRQLLPELAQRSRLSNEDLADLWRDAASPVRNGASTGAVADASAQGRPMRAPQAAFRAPARAPTRLAGRRPPAASADLALRLLLRHSDWWERLSGEDRELLHDLGGAHGAAVAWLERQIAEHGPPTWAALDAALDSSAEIDIPSQAVGDIESDPPPMPLAVTVRAWVEGTAFEDRHEFADLQHVLRRLHIDRLEIQARELATQATASDSEARQQLRTLLERIKSLKIAPPPPSK